MWSLVQGTSIAVNWFLAVNQVFGVTMDSTNVKPEIEGNVDMTSLTCDALTLVAIEGFSGFKRCRKNLG